jgi:hypothetical protein
MKFSDIPSLRVRDMSTRGKFLVLAWVSVQTALLVYLFIPKPESEETIQLHLKWRRTKPNNIETIVFSPLGSGSKSQKTIAAPIVISDKVSIEKIWNRLNSERRSGYYLKRADKWNDTRQIRLEVTSTIQSNTVFFVSWDDSISACRFGISRNRGYVMNSLMDEKASVELANILDEIIASNEVAWVSSYVY